MTTTQPTACRPSITPLGERKVDFVIDKAGGGTSAEGRGDVLASSLVLGGLAGAAGTYGVSNGRLDVVGNIIVAGAGTGQFDVSGGQVSFAGNVVVASQAGSTGTFDASGGSTTAGSR